MRLRIPPASQQSVLLAQGSFMAPQKQEAPVKFAKSDGDIKMTDCREVTGGGFCLFVLARTERIAAIIPSTFYVAQRH